MEVGAHVSHEDLKMTLTYMPKAIGTTKPRMQAESLMVDKDIIVGRLVHLQRHGVILYMVDFNPSRDAFKEWAY